MGLYATRRECEIILNCLYNKMSDLKLEEMTEYNKLSNRMLEVIGKQCKYDHTRYNREDE